MARQLTAENCKDGAGHLMPAINLNSCEGKGPCVDVCPYDVLQRRPVTGEKYRSLLFFGKLKTRVHGTQKAFVVNASVRHACGMFFNVCPERAIKLTRAK